MLKYKWIIIVFNLLLLLVLFNNSVRNKEKLLSKGQLILLPLAPVDPRSLMQGDYMQLNYAIANNNLSDNPAKRGYVVVKLNQKGIAQLVRLQESKSPIFENEFIINYTQGEWNAINIGAESFFFQEGQAQKYEKAEYGGIKVDNRGNSILIGLYDINRKRIE